MRKSNDTTTRELTEAELAAVSGGVTLENVQITSYALTDVLVSGYYAGGGGTGPGTGWDITKNKAG